MLDERLIAKLKYRVYREWPFFGPVSRLLTFEYNNDIPAAAGTDGLKIIVSDKFLQKDFKEQYFIYMHELMHVLYKHPVRFSMMIDKEHQFLFNIISDVKINEQLVNSNVDVGVGYLLKNNVMKFFKNCRVQFIDEQKVYTTIQDDKLSVEEQYDIIRQLIIFNNNNSSSDSSGDSSSDSSGDSSGSGSELAKSVRDLIKSATQQQREEIERKINEAIVQGIVEEKMRGLGSTKICKMFEELLMKKEVDWRKIVKNYIRMLLRGKRTYNKIHKKTYSNKIVIPGYKKKEKLDVVIGVDVSGSIDDKEFKKFVGECLSLLINYDAKMRIVQFDDKILSDEEVKKKSDICELKKRCGCGGTSYKEFFEKYGGSKVKVVFTDGYGDQNEILPVKHVVWLTTQNTNFNFGKVLKIKNE